MWEINAGNEDRKNPEIGISTNSRGKINCLKPEVLVFFDLISKSMYIKTKRANKQRVRINPDILGKLYPRLVLVNTGLRKAIRFAEIVIIYQLTGHKIWSIRTFPTR
jgi:hypothetical protein